ncbi:hypothetical protein, partial [Pseudomonas savastanoi]|uniref:hypothetical protein n=1 Tax=Pseudomonas savastanoi TaxID=29438 RepID=UPI001969F255
HAEKWIESDFSVPFPDFGRTSPVSGRHVPNTTTGRLDRAYLFNLVAVISSIYQSGRTYLDIFSQLLLRTMTMA